MSMDIGVITLFPEMLTALDVGITGRAIARGIINIKTWNPRRFTDNKHATVDDKPYGGGPGMVIQGPPLAAAIETAKQTLGETTKVIYVSPAGQRLDHQAVTRLSQEPKLILVSGRYEGIDQRIIDKYVDEQCSIGDYILSGGELAMMVIIDAVTRLQKGALGDEQSALQDSFCEGILDHPHYTRPEQFAGLSVPEVLLSGNHAAINRWRRKQALGQTWLQRSDLLQSKSLSQEEQLLLNEFIDEYHPH